MGFGASWRSRASVDREAAYKQLAQECVLAAGRTAEQLAAANEQLAKATGEIGACQYGLKEGSVGATLCYPPGEGATAQQQSEYALVASRHEREGGVFRVDLRSGAMSICYVLNDSVVCTPQAR